MLVQGKKTKFSRWTSAHRGDQVKHSRGKAKSINKSLISDLIKWLWTGWATSHNSDHCSMEFDNDQHHCQRQAAKRKWRGNSVKCVIFCEHATSGAALLMQTTDVNKPVLVSRSMTSTISNCFSKLTKQPYPSASSESDTDRDTLIKQTQDKKRKHIAGDSLEKEDENNNASINQQHQQMTGCFNGDQRYS